MHLLDGAVRYELTEAQIERAERGAAVGKHEERRVGDQVLAPSQIEREQLGA